jgi:hypothetical protein
LRSPVELSTAVPERAIDNVYVQGGEHDEPSKMKFETVSAVPQSVLVPGELTAAIASRSEHVPPGMTSSDVVVTVKLAAAARSAPTSETQPSTASVATAASNRLSGWRPEGGCGSTTGKVSSDGHSFAPGTHPRVISGAARVGDRSRPGPTPLCGKVAHDLPPKRGAVIWGQVLGVRARCAGS